MRASVVIEIEGKPEDIAHTRLKLGLAAPFLANVAETLKVEIVGTRLVEHQEPQ